MPSLPLRSLGTIERKYIEIHVRLDHQALSCNANSALDNARRRHHCGLRSGESFLEGVGLKLTHKESIDCDSLGVGRDFQAGITA